MSEPVVPETPKVDQDAADMAAALAALAGDDAAPVAAPVADVPAAEPPAAASIPVPEVPVSAAPAAGPADPFRDYMARIVRLEAERDSLGDERTQTARELAEAKAKAARYDELTQLVDKPHEILKRVTGMTPEQQFEFYQSGKLRDPVELAREKRMADLEKQIADDRAARTAEVKAHEHREALRQFRESIPTAVEKHVGVAKAPLLMKVYGQDAEGLKDILMQEMEHSFKVRGVDMNTAQAAERVEARLKAYAKVLASEAAPAAPAPTKPKATNAPTLSSNTPPAQASAVVDPDALSDAQRFELALKVLEAN